MLQAREACCTTQRATQVLPSSGRTAQLVQLHCTSAKMALRDFVTGSDMCTPDEGAGPSNAAATLANTLLGRSAKDQERLREVRLASTCTSTEFPDLRLIRYHKLNVQHAYIAGPDCTACQLSSVECYAAASGSARFAWSICIWWRLRPNCGLCCTSSS